MKSEQNNRNHGIITFFLYQNRALKSSDPVMKAGIVGECTKTRVAAVWPKNVQYFHKTKKTDFEKLKKEIQWRVR